MQAHLTDRKLSTLFEKYRDADFAANAGKEVEEIRNKALKKGAIATGAVFVLNEVARLSARSRKFESFQFINIDSLSFYIILLLVVYSLYSNLQVESIKYYFLVGCSYLTLKVLL